MQHFETPANLSLVHTGVQVDVDKKVDGDFLSTSTFCPLHLLAQKVASRRRFRRQCMDEPNKEQDSLAIAKTTARCAQYMAALKSFESPRKRPRLLFPKFVKGFCSDRY